MMGVQQKFSIIKKICGKEWVWPENFYDFIEYVTSYNWPLYIVTVRLLYPTV
jgi:hypothetical protein